MIWPRTRRAAPAIPATPDGYVLRAYHRDAVDVSAYVRLMQRAGFDQWDATRAESVFNTMYPAGLFFVIHMPTESLAATAAAQCVPREHHPSGGELGWVACDPDHRGKGLGYIICAAATHRLLQTDSPSLYLLTDDFRLPAIRIYLRLGWIPFLYLPEMEARWQAVCAQLGIPYTSLETTRDPAGQASSA